MLANVSPELPHQIWTVAAGAGFNGILILVLLWFGRGELRKIAEAMDRNSRSILILVLHHATHTEKQFRDESEKILQEVHDAEKERSTNKP